MTKNVYGLIFLYQQTGIWVIFFFFFVQVSLPPLPLCFFSFLYSYSDHPHFIFFSWLTTNFYSVFILFSVNPFPALTHRQKIYWLNRLSPNESTIQKQMFLDSFQNTFLYTYIYTHIHLYLSYMYVLGMFSIFLYIREFPKKQIWKKSN